MAYSIPVFDGFGDLPDLVLEEIFGYFEIFERIKLMSVCKRWKVLIECTLKQLCIYHSTYPVSRFWSYPTQKEVSDFDKVKVRFRRGGVLKYPSKWDFNYDYSYRDTEVGFPKFSFWKSIRKLAFYSCHSEHCELALTQSFNNLLNNMHQLNELAFEGVTLSSTFTKIELDNLKVLTLKKISIRDKSLLHLSLVTPKLESISLDLFRTDISIRLLYPEAVKSVRCFRFDETFEKCSNLESVSFDKIQRPADLLENHQKLKQIEAFPWDDEDMGGIQVLRRTKQQHCWRRPLKLIVSGSLDHPVFHFSRSFSLFFQFKVDAMNMSEFVGHCKRMVHPVPIFIGINDYSDLTEAFGGRLPSNFSTLFPEIRELAVNRKVDPEVFFDFLAGCKTLRSLYLSNCELNSQFYSRLAHLKLPVLRSLKELSIHEKEMKINFEFLFVMKNLDTFVWYLAERKDSKKTDFVVSIERNKDAAPCGPNVYWLSIEDNGSRVLDDADVNSECLENVVTQLCQHESVQKIWCSFGNVLPNQRNHKIIRQNLNSKLWFRTKTEHYSFK